MADYRILQSHALICYIITDTLKIEKQNCIAFDYIPLDLSWSPDISYRYTAKLIHLKYIQTLGT